MKVFDIDNFIFKMNLGEYSKVKAGSTVTIIDGCRNYYCSSTNTSGSISIGNGLYLEKLDIDIDDKLEKDLSKAEGNGVLLPNDNINAVIPLNVFMALVSRVHALEQQLITVNNSISTINADIEDIKTKLPTGPAPTSDK